MLQKGQTPQGTPATPNWITLQVLVFKALMVSESLARICICTLRINMSQALGHEMLIWSQHETDQEERSPEDALCRKTFWIWLQVTGNDRTGKSANVVRLLSQTLRCKLKVQQTPESSHNSVMFTFNSKPRCQSCQVINNKTFLRATLIYYRTSTGPTNWVRGQWGPSEQMWQTDYNTLLHCHGGHPPYSTP